MLGTINPDIISGLAGYDKIDFKEGKDQVNGNRRNDESYGVKLRDIIKGGHVLDKEFGEGSNDKLYGGTGYGDLNGGVGAITSIVARVTMAKFQFLSHLKEIPKQRTVKTSCFNFLSGLGSGDSSLCKDIFYDFLNESNKSQNCCHPTRNIIRHNCYRIWFIMIELIVQVLDIYIGKKLCN